MDFGGAGGLERLTIPVVLGSIRKGRRSERPARLVAERVAADGHEAALIDLKALALPMYDEEEGMSEHPGVRAFKQAMAAADATVWVAPEYNHGYPAALKNAIDYLGREIRRKPALVCGVAKGPLGGSRMVEQLKLVLIELHALPIRDSIYFGNPDTLWDAEGHITRPEVVQRIDEAVAELAWYARALAWGRQHLELPAHRRRSG